MRRLVTAIAAGLVFASIVSTQTRRTPAQGAKAPPAAKAEVSGTIKSVDPARGTVLLEDGTRLMIPGSVDVHPAKLRAGAAVKARVEEKGGRKIVTAIQIN